MGNNEKNPSEAPEKPLENDKIDAELAEAVKMSVESDKAEAAVAEELEKSAPAAEEPKKDAEVAAPERDEAPAEPSAAEPDIDDSLAERAVRAGLSLADVKSIKSKDALESILGRLESKSAKGDEGPGGEDGPAADDEEEEDPLADIDWDEFDPQIARAMKYMQSQNAALRKEVKSLKRAGESAQTQSFFEQQFGRLDENVRRHVDAVAKAKLKQKFDMLEAGYKAVKADVKRADVFREAARLALGDKLDRGAAETEAARLAKRRELAIAQPTRARGESRPQKTGDDIDREIAAVLEEKFPG